MFTAVMFCLHECTSALIIDCTLPPYAGHWRLQSGVLQLHHLLHSDQEGQADHVLESEITPAEIVVQHSSVFPSLTEESPSFLFDALRMCI